jgi:hypothetical protein
MITAARSALVALIEGAGVTCKEFIPERVTPPIAVMEPSSEWIASGDSYGEWRIAFDVTLVTRTASNRIATDNLDQMVEDVLTAVTNATGFYAGSVSSPQVLSVNNAEFLSVALTIYQNTRL